ncbi:MAG: DUF1828 domain-containing protein [Bacteroidota bacterium]|nr:DUF1828 domain-containing protein [Bacteroidota bacterium]HDR1103288.1 DUF1828 domain-containing protein [Pasteurella multocida]HDR1497509.1 DUF1828 domain-containing protein [Pasteurella multocida]
MINCQWLSNQTLLNCHKITSIDGSDGVCVQTYHKWLDGSILSFYIIQQGDHILITDECDTLFHFHTTGLIENKRNWRGIKERLNCTQTSITLEDDGEILCLSTKEKAPFAIADYISALCGLMHYEKELAGIPRTVKNLADEVEVYLRTWKPKANLVKSPAINGISGHTYHADFQFDKEIIFAIAPTPNSVGSVMRKTGDIISGGDLGDRSILVIVDDRTEQLFEQKAEEEIKIIASLVKAVPLSNLIKLANKSSSTQLTQ